MSFALFLLYLVAVLMRPIEFFELDVEQFRPMFVLWVCAFAGALFSALNRAEMAARPAHFVLVGGMLMAIVLSQLKQGWVGGAIASFFDFSTSAGFFVLVCLNVTSFKRLKVTCAVVLGCVTLVAAMGALSYHTGWMTDKLVLGQRVGDDDVVVEEAFGAEPIVPARDQSGLRLWRIRGLGFMNDPNDLAQAIVMVLPLLWGLARQGHRFANLFIVGAPTSLLVYAIYLTHSRGAILGMGSLFFFALRERLGTVRTTVMVAGVGVLAAVGGFGGGRQMSSGEESAGSRIEAWYEGIQMLKSSPIFGIGFANFTDHHHLTAHNSFVLCFAELGVLGYFFWIALLVLVYQGLNKVVADQGASAERRHAILLRSSVIGFLTCAWFLSRTYQPTLYLLLGLATSAWYCWAKRAGSTQQLAERTDFPWARATVVMMGGSFAAVYAFVVLDQMTGGG